MSGQSIRELDARTLPLQGNQLIEASAGTGKTYTIANLYLRLVLGHGDSSARQPLTVDQILVVTFTEAATKELRDRIRKRLQVARKAFGEGHSSDEVIQHLIDTLKHPEKCEHLLLLAERQMDEAAIFTIHGFCQRMLKQHAFESGSLFNQELVTDIEPLLKQSTADFWRQHFYPLDKPLAAIAVKLWKTPDDLLKRIREYLAKPDLKLLAGELPDCLETLTHQYVKPAIEIRRLWKSEHEIIENILLGAGLRKNSKPIARFLLMTEFAYSDELFPTLGNKESWEIYGTESLKKSLTKTGNMPEHTVFTLIDELLNQPMSLLFAFEHMILIQALKDIRQRCAELKDKSRLTSFDDLLSNLRRALTSPSGEVLANAIREQFPVAMIDEFQDTDPQQYSIFTRIYPQDNPEGSPSGLLMIGDPKQAIYAFRGADIFTYMQARTEARDLYSLGTNWRSTSAMINSVNKVFEHGVNAPFIYEAIPYQPVAPSPIADKTRLLENQKPLPALRLWLLESDDGVAISQNDFEEQLTEATAFEINRLLTLANSNQCVFHSEDEARPIQPNDIAVLVRNGRQARKIREALARKGIASVYLSSRESVFNTQEAMDISRLLDACLNPWDERILRTALATPLFNLSANELNALNENEQLWESTVEEFLNYQQIWHKQGVMPMLRSLTSHRQIAEQLLSVPDGERRLTDYLHIGELLAAASFEVDTPHALKRWLSERILTPDINAEEQQLHLESEQKLVRIVTIHKSKGLEYNLVFLPFATEFKEEKKPVYHDGKNTVLDFSGNDSSIQKADKERLAEDLRLLYVALTRSIHACYAGITALKTGREKKGANTDLHKTAVGWLLNGDQKIQTSELASKLEELQTSDDGILIESVPVPDSKLPRWQAPAEVKPKLEAAEFQGSIQKDWWVTSYSALSRTSHSQGHQTVQEPDASLETAGLDMEVLKENDESEPEAERIDIFTFPKGARPGTFLHALFENLEHLETNDSHSLPDDLSDYILEQLQTEGFDEKWCSTLETMLDHCLHAPLDDSGLSLAGLAPHSKKVEMEFYLPVSRLRARELNAILQSEDPLSAQAGLLDFVTVKGMLKGFIDLTFEYEGRWYVLDYKSNWLGDQLSDYTQDNMQKVMIEHRYDLQYQLYSLALHRLLSSRLPNYDFEQHFGGTYYLFLRGIRKDEPHRPGIYHCRPNKVLIEKLDRLFYGESAMSEERSNQTGVSS
ncbi:MAG: exodeoxyribonuclease V subunit beta [Endozoicomonas sp.]|uniref:exodeoxyribonuclease V subunit beta n=1 Tax=Endozoicomonas sp. TaxID=1892382 RepID=UPI003D9B9E70